MDYQHIQTERDDRIFTITINRPEVMNALAPQTHAEMAHALDSFEADDELWVAILTGAGSDAFCAGGDISAMQKAAEAGDADAYQVPASGYGGMTSRFSNIKPVIAAVNGMAFGGGFELALAADLVVASESASFGLPEPLVGAVAVAGGAHRLSRQIGLKRAMQILLTCDSIDAKAAFDYGVVNQLATPEELMEKAKKLARRICRASPMSIKATKQLAMQGLDYASVEQALAAQDQGDYPALASWMGSEDTVEGLNAFVEKRKPEWKNR